MSLIKIYLPLGLLLFLGVLIFRLFTSDTFVLKTVYIQGHPEALTDTSFLQTSQNVIFISTEKVQNEFLLKNPAVKSIDIQKQLPDALKITLIERLPVAYVMHDAIPWYVDAENIIIPKPAKLTGDLPLLVCGITPPRLGMKIATQELSTALHLVQKLRNEHIQVISVTCISEQMFTIQMPASEIIFSPTQNPDELASSLLFLFKQFRIEGTQPEVIDLRFDKPVLKTRGS